MCATGRLPASEWLKLSRQDCKIRESQAADTCRHEICWTEVCELALHAKPGLRWLSMHILPRLMENLYVSIDGNWGTRSLSECSNFWVFEWELGSQPRCWMGRVPRRATYIDDAGRKKGQGRKYENQAACTENIDTFLSSRNPPRACGRTPSPSTSVVKPAKLDINNRQKRPLQCHQHGCHELSSHLAPAVTPQVSSGQLTRCTHTCSQH